MIVRKLRLQRGWSQDQLAEMSGLSVRTIQRIERGQNAGLESLKSLAAVFEVDFNELNSGATMTDLKTPQNAEARGYSLDPDRQSSLSGLSSEEREALRSVRDIKGFYVHLACYAVTIPLLIGINFIWTPERLWVLWTALGWGLGVAAHGLNVFEVINLFSPEWEKRQVEKRLGRRL
ncbi:MAG: 2TM domain-containing protein [Pseudohongiellaceae bacterium]